MATYHEIAHKRELAQRRKEQDVRDAQRHAAFNIQAQDMHHKFDRPHFAVVGEGSKTSQDAYRAGWRGSSMAHSTDIVRYIRAISAPTLDHPEVRGATELVMDSSTGTIRYYSTGSTRTLMDLHNTQTATGTKTFTAAVVTTLTASAGSFTGAFLSLVTTSTADTFAPTVADSGRTYICTKGSSTQILTLPAASNAGFTVTLVCGHASGEIQVAVGTGDAITGKTHPANDGTGIITTTTTGLLKNTAATNVVGDWVTLVADGVTTYWMVSQAGVWSAT